MSVLCSFMYCYAFLRARASMSLKTHLLPCVKVINQAILQLRNLLILLLKASVKIFINLMELIILSFILKICLTFLSRVFMYHLTAGIFNAVIDACTDTGENGNTESRSLCSSNSINIASEHISHHLTLDTVLSSAAASHHIINFDTHLRENILAVSKRVADSLHYRTDNICFCVHT